MTKRLHREWPTLAILALMALISRWAWLQLPERIPVHYNLYGQPDRYGGRWEVAVFLPLMSLGLYVLLLLVPYIDPRREHAASLAHMMRIVRLVIIGFLAVVYAATVGKALGYPVNIPLVIGVANGGLFLILGNYLPKVQSNFFAGIRTPWTLSSERSWNQTHRLGGKCFVLAGLLQIVLTLLWPRWAFVYLIFLIIPNVIGLAVYSYVVWKHDPDRERV